MNAEIKVSDIAKQLIRLSFAREMTKTNDPNDRPQPNSFRVAPTTFAIEKIGFARAAATPSRNNGPPRSGLEQRRVGLDPAADAWRERGRREDVTRWRPAPHPGKRCPRRPRSSPLTIPAATSSPRAVNRCSKKNHLSSHATRRVRSWYFWNGASDRRNRIVSLPTSGAQRRRRISAQHARAGDEVETAQVHDLQIATVVQVQVDVQIGWHHAERHHRVVQRPQRPTAARSQNDPKEAAARPRIMT